MIKNLFIDDTCVFQLKHYKKVVIPSSLYFAYGEKKIIDYFLEKRRLHVKVEIISHEGSEHEAWPYCDGIRHITNRKIKKLDITVIVHLLNEHTKYDQEEKEKWKK